MAKANVFVKDGIFEAKCEGTIDFDEMDYDNNDVHIYQVAIVNPDTDEYEGVERYLDEGSWMVARFDTYGRRELDMEVDEDTVDAIVRCGCDGYNVEATAHTAYVVDSDEE